MGALPGRTAARELTQSIGRASSPRLPLPRGCRFLLPDSRFVHGGHRSLHRLPCRLGWTCQDKDTKKVRKIAVSAFSLYRSGVYYNYLGLVEEQDEATGIVGAERTDETKHHRWPPGERG